MIVADMVNQTQSAKPSLNGDYVDPPAYNPTPDSYTQTRTSITTKNTII